MNTLLQKCVKIVLFLRKTQKFHLFSFEILLLKGGSNMFTLLICIIIVAIGGGFFLLGQKRSS